MKGIGSVVRWRLAVPIFAIIAAVAAVAAPGTAQGAGAPQSGGNATAPEVPTRPAVTPAPPMPGYTPVPAPCDVFCRTIYYTGTDSHVYDGSGGPSLGGRVIGGPGVGLRVVGRGFDNALWQYEGGNTWSSRGGRLTSRPGVARGTVVVRGTDSAVWVKQTTDGTHWSGWRSLGGRVLAGSGPAAVNTGGTLYVLAVGTDRAVWAKHSTDGTRWSSWGSLGGRVSGDLGAASPAQGIGLVFARGTDNAAWYNQFAGTTTGVTPGWHSLGGRLTSGVGGFGGNISEEKPNEIIIDVMGADNGIWQRAGSWPALGPWQKA